MSENDIATPGSLTNGAVVSMNNPKRLNVEEVANGFVVSLTNKRDWMERRKIASTKEEAMSIISDYLSGMVELIPA